MFNYEIWTPDHFEKNSDEQHGLVVEIYGGPGSQKVLNRWSFGLSSHFATSNCSTCLNAIHVKLDARGSGNSGDEMMHATYKKLGWFEKVDITEFVRALVFNQPTINWLNPISGKIDADKTAIWGWSYGGFATLHTLSLGDDVWKCGVSAAALNSRYYYDSIYTEMAMDTPENNFDGYSNGTVTDQGLNNLKKVKLTMLHGTADDNVHFQNGALISKELVKAGVEFNNYFYADEAHHMTGNADRHAYRLIFRKIEDCFEGEL